jgi:hypothetical protein
MSATQHRLVTINEMTARLRLHPDTVAFLFLLNPTTPAASPPFLEPAASSAVLGSTAGVPLSASGGAR